MLDRAARHAWARLVSALAGAADAGAAGFRRVRALAGRRAAPRGVCGRGALRYKPAAPAADNPTLAGLQTVNPDVCGWLTVDGTGIDYRYAGARRTWTTSTATSTVIFPVGRDFSRQPLRRRPDRPVHGDLRPPHGQQRDVRRCGAVCGGRLFCRAPAGA